MIKWIAPDDNFNAILGYKVEVRQADGVTWYEDQVNCDGSNPNVRANTECYIPMMRFQQPPLNLVLGQPIRVRISAYNTIGINTPSVVNDATTLVNTVPLKPDAPTRGANTNTNQVDLRWGDLDAQNRDGGSVITSYEVLWDDSTNGQVWTELTGYTVPLATPYYTATGLTMGRRYKFKIRAQNVHGWGPYSDEGEVLVATAPDQMGLIVVTENSD